MLKVYGMIAFQFDVHPMLMTIEVDMQNKREIGNAVCYAFAGIFFSPLNFAPFLNFRISLQIFIRFSLNILKSELFSNVYVVRDHNDIDRISIWPIDSSKCVGNVAK